MERSATQPVRPARPGHARQVVLTFLLALLGAMGCGEDASGPQNLQPEVNRVEPDSGTVGTQVEITGGSFQAGASVLFGALNASGEAVLSSNTLHAFAPDSLVAGTFYEVRVTNPLGKTDAIESAFKAVGPDLQVVNGVTRPSGISGSTIIFEGHAFGDLLGKGHIWFTGAGGAPVEAPVLIDDNWTNEFLVTTVPSQAESGPVWVETATGTSRSQSFTVTEGSSFSPSQIFWTETISLPQPSQGHKAVFLSGDDLGLGNMIYLTGGGDGSMNVRTGAWSATVDAVGGVLPWSGVSDLPEARAFHGMTLATPYNAFIDTTSAGHLYVLGGISQAGSPVSTVWRAPVGLDRSVGGWTIENSLPAPLHSMGVAVFRSWLFVVGGATSGNQAVTTVYRARIEPDGSLGSWESQPSLPAPSAYGTLLQFAGALYMVGGDAGTTLPGSAANTATLSDAIFTAALDLRSARVNSWSTNPSSLIKRVAKHTALIAGGTVLVSGGVYNGAGSSATEHQYASINLDGTIGSFNGATGSQTIADSGGQPFFNHAAVTYVDASGIAHVLILGGNDINNPATPLDAIYYY